MILQRICFTFLFGLVASASFTAANAQLIGDTVNVNNTFEDSNVNTNFTGGVETIFGDASAVVADPGQEFSLFAGIYDIDVVEDSLTMTFANNDSIGIFDYGVGTFDRYYFGFDGHTVDSISIDAGGAAELTAGLSVGLLASGFELNVADLFGTGIPVPQTFDNGGFFVQFAEGTDYNDGTLGESVSFSFTTTAVPEPASGVILCGLAGIAMIRRRR